MQLTIIATSLNEESKSQKLARVFEGVARAEGVECTLVDLRVLELPFAGASGSWECENVNILREAVDKASHIVFAVPIYCYDVNAAAKNVIELMGRSFTDKVVGFICAAGGSSSYMSVMGMANHLMLDFRSVIVPRFVYVGPDGWNGECLGSEIQGRLDLLLTDLSSIKVEKR